ncbi:hypothetical protein LCGC14_0791050, partial [marine sediment metagenome]
TKEDETREAFEQAFLDLPDVDDNLLARGGTSYVIGETEFAFYMFKKGAEYREASV